MTPGDPEVVNIIPLWYHALLSINGIGNRILVLSWRLFPYLALCKSNFQMVVNANGSLL
jgi:hypothetical protein